MLTEDFLEVGSLIAKITDSLSARTSRQLELNHTGLASEKQRSFFMRRGFTIFFVCNADRKFQP
jgi:hypothetical protein